MPAKRGAPRVYEEGDERRRARGWLCMVDERVKGQWESKGVDPVTCLPLREPRIAAGKPNLLSTYWPNYLLLPQIYFAY